MTPDIEVELTMLPTEHGGLKLPVTSGYRPQFYYRNDDCDAEHNYLDAEEVRPGDTVIAHLSFYRSDFHVPRVYEGMPFLIREGKQTVVYGRILRVLGTDGLVAP